MVFKSSMSLSGFNANRRVPYSNLSGAVGSSVVVKGGGRPRPGGAPTPRPLSSLHVRVTTKQVPPDDRLEKGKRKEPEAPKSERRGDGTPPIGSVHWTYGTANVDLTECGTERRIAQKGSRVVLVFPMEKHGDVVRMRLKRVDPETASPSHHWVPVYDPNLDDPRLVDDYSLLP